MSTMTDREKVVRLATEVMGWTMRPAHESRRLVIDCGDGRIRHLTQINGLVDVWSPLESISDAMEMQAKIPEALRWEYVTELLKRIEPNNREYPATKTYWMLVNATARQRCDAAISALEDREAVPGGALMTVTEDSLECTECDWVGFESEAEERELEFDDSEYLCPACNGICAHFPLDEIGREVATNISQALNFRVREGGK